MKAVVMGAGRMGQAIAWSMDKFGYEIFLVDNNSKNLFDTEYDFSKVSLIHASSEDYFKDNADIVISAMPYHQNFHIAKKCIESNVPYCDLGGSVPVSRQINELARQKGATVITDLGLAPGWVNIIAEDGAVQSSPESIKMMVGGLPKNPNNYLKYNCTWSYDGLINEYKDSCEVLVNGFQTIVQGMEGLELVETSLGVLEAFYTSGGAAHSVSSMQDRGVKNCYYKTLRYQGHRDAMRFLMYECGLDGEDLKQAIIKACPPAEDIVVVRVDVDGTVSEKIVESCDKFSAMQKATAFPISSVADLIGRRIIEGPSSYKDVPYQTFESNLNQLFNEVKDAE